MLKSEIIAALEKLHGDPEIEVKVLLNFQNRRSHAHGRAEACFIDRINEYPRPEIVVIEK